MAEITRKLKSWTTPNYVLIEAPPGRRQDGFTALQSIPLSDVDAETLSALCDEFRNEIFEKAGKRDPSLEDERA